MQEPIHLVIESGIPVPDENYRVPLDLQERIEGAIRALEFNEEFADVDPPSDADRSVARRVFQGDTTAADEMNMSVAVHMRALLTEYDHQIIQSTVQLRTYITNRLLLESDHPDARVRLKALEMLGRISDVGLFTDKTEVTHKYEGSADLEGQLRAKLQKLMAKRGPLYPGGPEPVVESVTFREIPDKL